MNPEISPSAQVPYRGRREFLARLAAMACLPMIGRGAEQIRPPLRIAYFLDFSVQDAADGEQRTLFEPWVRELVMRCTVTQPEQVLFDSWEAFIGKLRANPATFADVFPMYGYDFVDYRQECGLDALVVPDFGAGTQVEYGIYVSESSRITKLEDLYRKTITVEIGGRGGLPLYWVDNVIRRETQFGREGFANFRNVSTPLRAVLPVFFKRSGVDACIVTTQGFEEVAARNPQVSKRLRQIVAAPKLLSHVIACRKELAESIRNEVTSISLGMAQRNGPRFAGPRMTLFEAEMLGNLEKEWDEHLRNMNKIDKDGSGQTGGIPGGRGLGPGLPAPLRYGAADDPVPPPRPRFSYR